MKKLIFATLLSLFAIPSFAQRASDADVSSWGGDESWNHSGAFTELVLGGVVGDMDGDFGVGVNLGYRLHIWNGICWDVLKVGINGGVSHLSDTLDMRFISGLRYNTPAVVGGKSLYLNCAFGYHFLTDNTDLDGFAYEVGAGVNLNPNFSMGITWEASQAETDGYYSDYDYNWGIIGLKLAYQF